MARLQLALPLAVAYLALAYKYGDNPLPHLVFGLLVGLGVSALLPVRVKTFDWSYAPVFFWGLARYAARVLVDMFKSAYQVALIVLDPKLPINPGVVAIQSGCKSPIATALSAHAITLTPGEMVIAIDDDHVLYTHTLDVSRSAEYSAQAQALRRDLLSKIVP